ncbi:agmatine deiminase family protein [Fastidiosibacter lacustris]|uniref:agmatine deiminase family protein n=1 Tax=Fastidiosibacter lacustris TaxID=2056695 RepID=UPI000E352577|nr:agmatine deiminase family protein [Fastidiosibacter lacustris]
MQKYLPAEWQKHSATWMIWPIRYQIWPNFEKACQVYANVANKVSEYETVKVIVAPEQIKLARQYLSQHIHLIQYQADDSWARDSAPIFMNNNGSLLALNWRFNAWGEKFLPYDQDQKLKLMLAQIESWDTLEIDMVLEGGAIHSNGQGTLLTTAECLLNSNRNKNLSKKEIEQNLSTYLNVSRQLWLPFGIDGDVDTDGHVDNVACFSNEKTICIQACYDQLDENYVRHNHNMSYLQQIAPDLDVVEIPQPQKRSFQGERLALSYLNFYICNGALIMPKFDQEKEDQNAKTILQEQFPTYDIHQINVQDLVVGGGGIHCITMQQPKC